MDSRITLQHDESFLEILIELMENKSPAAVLYDDNGPTRAEGLITSIRANSSPANFIIDDRIEIAIPTLIAVNGMFKDDYSEC